MPEPNNGTSHDEVSLSLTPPQLLAFFEPSKNCLQSITQLIMYFATFVTSFQDRLMLCQSACELVVMETLPLIHLKAFIASHLDKRDGLVLIISLRNEGSSLVRAEGCPA